MFVIKTFKKVGLAFFFCIATLQANPSGENVQHGDVNLSRSDNTLNITQNSDKAIINWQDFSIQASEVTKFIQPSSNSAILNKVISDRPTEIYGKLEANGQVYLLNQNGILVGKEAIIDTAKFFASTLNLSEEEFLKDQDFNLSGSSIAKIENFGVIKTIGDVCLIAKEIQNLGEISSEGKVSLLGADEVLLVKKGDDRVAIKVKGDGLVHENGLIEAVEVELKASQNNPYALAINQEGQIFAKGAVNRDGKIILIADPGLTEVKGELKAQNFDKTGGTIHVLGDRVGLFDNAKIDVSSDSNGGEALIGGDFRGKNPEIKNAEAIFVSPDVQINAGSLVNGNGGKVIAWGVKSNKFYGSVFASGGKVDGNGGLIEISSPYGLEYHPHSVDTSSKHPETGMLLLDPTDIFITASVLTSIPPFPTSTSPGNWYYQPDIYTTAYIKVIELESGLAGTGGLAFNNVTIISDTAGGSTGKGDISVGDAISWSSNKKLSLQAYRSIQIGANIGNSSSTSFSVLELHAYTHARQAGDDQDGIGVDANCSISTSNGAIDIIANGAGGRGIGMSDNSTISTLNGDIHITASDNLGRGIGMSSGASIYSSNDGSIDINANNNGADGIGMNPNAFIVTRNGTLLINADSNGLMGVTFEAGAYIAAYFAQLSIEANNNVNHGFSFHGDLFTISGNMIIIANSNSWSGLNFDGNISSISGDITISSDLNHCTDALSSAGYMSSGTLSGGTGTISISASSNLKDGLDLAAAGAIESGSYSGASGDLTIITNSNTLNGMGSQGTIQHLRGNIIVNANDNGLLGIGIQNVVSPPSTAYLQTLTLSANPSGNIMITSLRNLGAVSGNGGLALSGFIKTDNGNFTLDSENNTYDGLSLAKDGKININGSINITCSSNGNSGIEVDSDGANFGAIQSLSTSAAKLVTIVASSNQGITGGIGCKGKILSDVSPIDITANSNTYDGIGIDTTGVIQSNTGYIKITTKNNTNSGIGLAGTVAVTGSGYINIDTESNTGVTAGPVSSGGILASGTIQTNSGGITITAASNSDQGLGITGSIQSTSGLININANNNNTDVGSGAFAFGLQGTISNGSGNIQVDTSNNSKSGLGVSGTISASTTGNILLSGSYNTLDGLGVDTTGKVQFDSSGTGYITLTYDHNSGSGIGVKGLVQTQTNYITIEANDNGVSGVSIDAGGIIQAYQSGNITVTALRNLGSVVQTGGLVMAGSLTTALGGITITASNNSYDGISMATTGLIDIYYNPLPSGSITITANSNGNAGIEIDGDLTNLGTISNDSGSSSDNVTIITNSNLGASGGGIGLKGNIQSGTAPINITANSNTYIGVGIGTTGSIHNYDGSITITANQNQGSYGIGLDGAISNVHGNINITTNQNTNSGMAISSTGSMIINGNLLSNITIDSEYNTGITSGPTSQGGLLVQGLIQTNYGQINITSSHNYDQGLGISGQINTLISGQLSITSDWNNQFGGTFAVGLQGTISSYSGNIILSGSNNYASGIGVDTTGFVKNTNSGDITLIYSNNAENGVGNSGHISSNSTLNITASSNGLSGVGLQAGSFTDTGNGNLSITTLGNLGAVSQTGGLVIAGTIRTLITGNFTLDSENNHYDGLSIATTGLIDIADNINITCSSNLNSGIEIDTNGKIQSLTTDPGRTIIINASSNQGSTGGIGCKGKIIGYTSPITITANSNTYDGIGIDTSGVIQNFNGKITITANGNDSLNNGNYGLGINGNIQNSYGDIQITTKNNYYSGLGVSGALSILLPGTGNIIIDSESNTGVTAGSTQRGGLVASGNIQAQSGNITITSSSNSDQGIGLSGSITTTSGHIQMTMNSNNSASDPLGSTVYGFGLAGTGMVSTVSNYITITTNNNTLSGCGISGTIKNTTSGNITLNALGNSKNGIVSSGNIQSSSTNFTEAITITANSNTGVGFGSSGSLSASANVTSNVANIVINTDSNLGQAGIAIGAYSKIQSTSGYIALTNTQNINPLGAGVVILGEIINTSGYISISSTNNTNSAAVAIAKDTTIINPPLPLIQNGIGSLTIIASDSTGIGLGFVNGTIETTTTNTMIGSVSITASNNQGLTTLTVPSGGIVSQGTIQTNAGTINILADSNYDQGLGNAGTIQSTRGLISITLTNNNIFSDPSGSTTFGMGLAGPILNQDGDIQISVNNNILGGIGIQNDGITYFGQIAISGIGNLTIDASSNQGVSSSVQLGGILTSTGPITTNSGDLTITANTNWDQGLAIGTGSTIQSTSGLLSITANGNCTHDLTATYGFGLQGTITNSTGNIYIETSNNTFTGLGCSGNITNTSSGTITINALSNLGTNSTDGGMAITGTVQTNVGDITLTANSNSKNGFIMDTPGIIQTTTSGKISIVANTNGAVGVGMNAGNITTAVGDISFTGDGNLTLGGDGAGVAINGTVTSTSGVISIEGNNNTGSSNSGGVGINGTVQTTSSNINIVANTNLGLGGIAIGGTVESDSGIISIQANDNVGGGIGLSGLINTTSGNISLDSENNQNTGGIGLYSPAQITSTSGDITITSNNPGLGYGIISSAAIIKTTASNADILIAELGGNSINKIAGNFEGYNVTLQANQIILSATVKGRHSVVMQPVLDTDSIAVIGGSGTLSVNVVDLSAIDSSTPNVYIGSSTGSHTINVGSGSESYLLTYPITFRGDSVNIDASLTAGNSGNDDVSANIGQVNNGDFYLRQPVSFLILGTGHLRVNGGSNDDTFHIITTSTQNNGVINGNSGNNTLIGPNATRTWNITGINSGNLGSSSQITYSNIQNLTGGIGTDTFTFSVGGQITGNIDGGGGNATINGPNQTTSWTITANNGGYITPTSVGPSNFSNITTLSGGSSNDTFIFNGQYSLTSINGGGGSGNQITGPDFNTNWVITSSNAGSITAAPALFMK
ncbi:MAG: hypothetical protein HZB76_01800 [Chlamydiae bacterium]|nr:hypothetical protein [Chlamydiota bacterium]